MDLGLTSTLHKGGRKKGKGPYRGVRIRGGRWVSEIRIPKTTTRIWLGSHHSPEKAARAYDAALYCLKGNRGSFNFPNNRRPYLADWSVGSLPIDEIQYIAAEFSCLNESMATSEPTSMSPPRAVHLSLGPPVLPDPQMNEIGGNKVDGEPNLPDYVLAEEPYVPTFTPEEEPYVPTFAPEEEPYAPTHLPAADIISHGKSQLEEWFSLDGDWMPNFL